MKQLAKSKLLCSRTLAKALNFAILFLLQI